MGPILKPIAFILVGILVGASVGVGAAYLYILPNAVKPQMEELSQRLSEVESSISILADIQSRVGDQLSRAEESVKSINPLANRVSTIEESISSLDNLSQSILMVENSIISIESEINEINNQLISLQESLNNIYYSDIASLQDELASLESNMTKLVSQVDKIVIRLEKDLAYNLLKKALAEQDGYIATRIKDELFDELKSSSTEFVQWINLAGSEHVKSVLESVIDSQLPTFVWHDHYISKIKTDKYMTYVVTYFPITIDTGSPSIGEITNPRVGLIIVGIVNVAKERVSSIEIESLYL